MAGRHRVSSLTAFSALLLSLGLFGGAPLYAQQSGETTFEILPDGTPSFTQVFRWSADPSVLFYEVTVQTSTGGMITQEKLNEPVLKLNLRPGEYRYRIVLYNLLGKPELELPWTSFSVNKAQMPRVTAVSPKVWFLEDLKPVLSVSGANLMPGATIRIEDRAANAAPIAGTETAREGTASLSASFPIKSVREGVYTLEVVNPGGLSVTLPDALVVHFQRPVDLVFSGGYGPWIPLYDAWSTSTWPGPVFVSGVARFSVYFLKREWGFLGAEVETSGRTMQGGLSEATIQSRVGLTGINVIYCRRFSPRLSAKVAAGSGVAIGDYRFDYAGVAGPAITSADPYISSALSLQYYFGRQIFVELGCGWVQVLARGYTTGGVMPFLSGAYLF